MLAYWVVPWLIFLSFNDVFHPISYVQLIHNRISGVIVSVLVLSAVDQTKDYKIGICCFSAKHAALRGKSKD
jgi:hypothetical protein